MRHRRNNNKTNKQHKQDGVRGRDVDESELGDQLPGRAVSGSAALMQIIKVKIRASRYSSARIPGSALAQDKKDDSGSALEVKQLRHSLGLTSEYEENIAAGDVLLGLCYFPICIRQMLYSHLDQAITQTSLFA